MKTFLFNSLNRYKRFSEKIDVDTIICNKTWWVFNDSGEKEIFIFQENGALIISVNGMVTNASWKYISANKSIIVNTKDNNVMLVPSFIDKNIFCLQLDGTRQYVFLIDQNNKNTFAPQSLHDLENYFVNKARSIERKEQREKEVLQLQIREKQETEKRANELKRKRIEAEKKEKEKQKLLHLQLENDTNYIQLAKERDSVVKKVEVFKWLFLVSFLTLIIFTCIQLIFDLVITLIFIPI